MKYTLLEDSTESRQIVPRQQWCNYRYLFIVGFCGSCLIISINNFGEIVFPGTVVYAPNWYKQYYNKSVDKFTIKTVGCTIPTLRPFDDSIKKYIENPPKTVVCPNKDYFLLKYNKTHITITKNKKDLEFYKVKNRSSIDCCYYPFYRPVNIDNIYSKFVDDRIKYDGCRHFNDTIKVVDEFVKVECFLGKNIIASQYFLSAIKKAIIKHNNVKEIPKDKPAYNVLVLGLDAISRMNFYRTMPKTLNYLKSKGVVELQGYNKVGDNTFPNLVPVLMGISEAELKKSCHPFHDANYDNCPFIWDWYTESGYYTALGEDSGWLGTFNYANVGFHKSPTTYYLHPFFKQIESTKSASLKSVNSNLCLNQTFIYKLFLDYVEDLTETLRTFKLFGFFWEVTMSHDYLNYPVLMDDDYEKFLQRLDASGYLNETVLFVMSDHGIRWGGIRNTKQGRLEERLPFVYMLMPPSFRENYSIAFNNLKKNSRHLTTPFDVHETLNDLIDLKQLTDLNVTVRSKQSYAGKRGISLFLPIPSNRTCESAEIADHWCTCHRYKTIDTKSMEAREAAKNLVDQINAMLLDHPQCMHLELANVVDAGVMEAEVWKEEKDWKEFLMVVRTEPGGAVFEGTLRHEGDKWTVTGTISRLNLYGTQSHCVHDAHLKLYCYCSGAGTGVLALGANK